MCLKVGFYDAYIVLKPPASWEPSARPAPWRDVRPMDGDRRSRMAKTTAATVATTTISSTFGTLRGMITIATATARPSRKYLMARVRSSVAEKPSILSYTPG